MKTTGDKSESESGIYHEKVAFFWLRVLGDLGMTKNNKGSSELFIFPTFHLRRYLDIWNFNLHFLTKHSSGKKFVGCFIISI